MSEEKKSPEAVRPEAGSDRTIVIPAEELEKPQFAVPPPPEERETRRSILSDLGNFLFPRRSVVDETIELIREGVSAEAGDGGIRSESETPPCDVNAQYSLEERPFASGGQGGLFRATDRSLGCGVAVKSLHEKLCSDEHARGNFLNEARITAALDHPAVIPIHGIFGDRKNGLHLSMKLISGHSLCEYLDSIVRVYSEKGILRFDEHKSLRNRLEIMLKVCEAVEYAHARKIVHRDLKPENIMIGKHRETYVTDWGLALPFDEARHLKKVDGTPAFIAPEVLRNRCADARSDIYSLGVILFEMVTLKPAFRDRDVAAVLRRVRSGAHASIRHRFGCRIDADLKAIIRKAIAPDPEDRYMTVSAFSEDLRRYLTGEETLARPDNPFMKVCRWSVKHRRGMLLATMTVLLLGIAGMARSLYLEMRWSTERRLRDNAVSAAYADATAAAHWLSNSMERIEYKLEQFRLNLLFSVLKLYPPDTSEERFFVPMAQYRTSPPPGFVYSESYRQPIDFDGASVLYYRGKKPAGDYFRHFAEIARYMRESLREPRPNGTVPTREDLRRSGSPIRFIYFALADGVYACHPGGDEYGADYYPPNRPWYRRAMEGAGRIVWSAPYRDSGRQGELVITCSTALYGADRKFVGVGAIDFSLTQMASELLKPESRLARFTREKMLINADGEVIFRMSPPGRAVAKPFDDAVLIRRMVRRKFGTLLTETDGRETVLAFAYLDPINVIYVESLDLAPLVEDLRKVAAVERAPR